MSLLVAGSLARGGELLEGWIEVEGERVVAAGEGPAPPAAERPGGVIAPALCDLQVNGAAGEEAAGGRRALDAIDAAELAHGVTTYLPTLISPDDETAERALDEIAAHAADPASPIAGAHVEGPFLSADRAGMHPAERLRAPADGVPGWLDSPVIRMVTLAPELPGALELVERLAGRGVVVSLGHSDADAATARAAIEAGASMVTHVFNAMAPLHHRAPGLAAIALTDERVRVSVIADGIHVDAVALELVRRAAGRRVVLVSDSAPAAAAAPGRYEMAGMTTEAGDEGSRTAGGILAGSTLTLDAGARAWAELTGATVAEAIAAASEAPAGALGLPPPLSPGAPADLCVLDDAGTVRRAMRAGRWIG